MILLLTTSAIGALIAGTTAQLNSQTANPNNLFATAFLILTEHHLGGSTCFSTDPNPACDALFATTGAQPGATAAGRIVLKKIGNVTARSLAVWTAGCNTIDSQGEQFHGSGDLCSSTQLTLHDDTNDACYFPVAGPGACGFAAGATLASFAQLHPLASPLTLTTTGIEGGIVYTVAARIDPASGNTLQGRAAGADFTWLLSA